MASYNVSGTLTVKILIHHIFKLMIVIENIIELNLSLVIVTPGNAKVKEGEGEGRG